MRTACVVNDRQHGFRASDNDVDMFAGIVIATIVLSGIILIVMLVTAIRNIIRQRRMLKLFFTDVTTENHNYTWLLVKGEKEQAAADVSVDSNANVDDISIIAYEAEVPKPLFRINAYYLLWKYGKKLFGKEEAEKLCKAQFFKDYYINDFHKFATSPYCFNFS